MSPTTQARIVAKAIQVRDAALKEYREVKLDSDGIYGGMDPGDARVTLDGNRHNVLTVLNFLKLLGVPGCKT